jgi:PAS domain S-box-containing protein
MVDSAAPRRLETEPPEARSRRRWLCFIATLLTLAIGLGATAATWHASRLSEQATARIQFEFGANTLVSEITDRLSAHEQMLWGAVGLIASSSPMTPDIWRTYFEAVQLAQRLPGTRIVGFIKRVSSGQMAEHVQMMQAYGFPNYHIWPATAGPEFNVITLMEPLDERQRLLGYDVASNAERRAALEQSRDNASLVVSSKVPLLSLDAHAGFLMFIPVYRNGAPISTVAERRDALIGHVYSTFRVREFIMSRAVEQFLARPGAQLEIYDGVRAREQDLMFRAPDTAPTTASVSSFFVTTVAEIVGGRTWTFRVAAPQPTAQLTDPQRSVIVLGAGILITLMAAAVVCTLVRNRAQAVAANARLRADMARRVLAEEQLRQSETKFRRLFDNIPLPTFVIDRHTWRYVEVNEAAVAKYGYSHEEFSRMGLADIRPPEDVPGMARYIASMQNSDSHGTQFRHRTRDGRVIDVEIMAHRVLLDEREAVIVVAHDVTERNQAQAALANSQQQLQQAQKLEAVGQLTGGIAHDFNNILTVITGTIEILAEGVGHDPKLVGIARMIDEAASRGADLTRHLLAFARRQPLQPHEVDVNALVVDAAKLCRSTLGEQVEVETSLEEGLWPAYVDPTQLTTALLNLALNARDAMVGGGKLVIETANAVLDEAYARKQGDVQPGYYVAITVSDTGEGIPADIRDKVFEPFFTTKEVGKGTGLGLSMVYGFLKQSGGHIKIYSEINYGSSIKVYLPRAGAEPMSVSPSTTPDIVGGNETILVVEDDALVRNYVTAQLRNLGYRIHVAANAAEALAMVDAGTPFELLFTDVVMPGAMNGRQLAQEVLKRRPQARVLFTSGYTEEAAMRQGHLDQGVNLLSKPYRKAELARKVRDALEVAPAFT